MKLEPCNPTYTEVAQILSDHQLFPDAWKSEPLALVGSVNLSKFWLIRGKRRLIGLVWLSDIIPGDSAAFHILMDKKFKGYMRPTRKLDKRTSEDNHARHKLDCFYELLDYAFEEKELMRVSALIPRSRKSAMRLCNRLGFAKEGVMVHGSRLSGKIDDLVIWGYTREMYAAEMKTAKTA